MTVHIPKVASPASWHTAPPSGSGRASSAFGGDHLLRAKRISLQSWVVWFAAADAVLLAGLAIAPTWLGHALQPRLISKPAFDGQIEAIAIALCTFWFSARLVRLYRTSRILELSYSLQRALVVLLMTFAFLMVLGAATKTTHIYSRLWFFAWMSTSIVLLPAFRILALRWAGNALRKGSFVHRALSVGIDCEPLAAEAINTASKGLVWADTPLRLQSIAELSTLPALVSHLGIDKVYIKSPWHLSPQIGASIGGLRNLSADVFLVPEAVRISRDVVGVQQLAGNVSLQIIDRPIDGWNYWLKRTQDVTVAVVALILLAPILVLIAAAIRLESRGPDLFPTEANGI